MSLGRDGVVGLILLAISLGLLVQAFQLPRLPIVPVGPGFYPSIVLVFMAAMSALLVVQDIRTGPGWAAVLAVAIGTAAITYFIFERYLLVLLPRGAWTGF
jgi:putative tricarboxylic transport membrane protein